MKLNRTGSIWDRNERNKINDNWDKLEGNINNFQSEITDKVFAEIKDSAKLNWGEPVNSFNNLPKNAKNGDTRFTRDTGKVYRYDGTNWVEIQQIDAGPVNELDRRVTQQLAETATQALDWDRRGILKLPSDFPVKIPFEIFRNVYGNITHNYNFDYWDDAQVLHVKTDGGGSNDPTYGDEDKPFSSVKYAIDQAHSRSGDKWIIKIMNKRLTGGSSWGITPNTLHTFNIEKNLKIMPHKDIEKVIASSSSAGGGYSWSKEENVYYTSRSLLEKVYDSKFKDARGNFVSVERVDTLGECKATPNTYYYSNNIIYIHRKDSSAPDDDIHLITQLGINLLFNVNNCKFFIEDIQFAYNSRVSSSDQECVKITGNIGSEFIHRRCSFGASRLNGLAVDTKGHVYGFHSDAHNNNTDGFNYHDTSGNAKGFVFEFDCYASFNGNTGGSTFNATTAHDGMAVLRVGSIGHDCRGPILADVNGCYSINVDCNMYDSTRSSGSTRAGFWFDNAGTSGRIGKAYLINCSGGGVGTYTVNTDRLVEVYTKNLKGNNIPEAVLLNQIT